MQGKPGVPLCTGVDGYASAHQSYAWWSLGFRASHRPPHEFIGILRLCSCRDAPSSDDRTTRSHHWGAPSILSFIRFFPPTQLTLYPNLILILRFIAVLSCLFGAPTFALKDVCCIQVFVFHSHLEQNEDEPYGSSSTTFRLPLIISAIPLRSLLEILRFHICERVNTPCLDSVSKPAVPETDTTARTISSRCLRARLLSFFEYFVSPGLSECPVHSIPVRLEEGFELLRLRSMADGIGSERFWGGYGDCVFISCLRTHSTSLLRYLSFPVGSLTALIIPASATPKAS